MKAVILAGGKGSRMGAVTKYVPKPMISLAGKPILEYQIELAKRYDLDNIIILTGYREDVIRDYFKDGKTWGLNIQYNSDPFPLGTAGAVKRIEQELTEDFILFYGDTIIDIDLHSLVQFHQEKYSTATLVVHPNDHPYDSDLLDIDEHNRVTAFYSKPHAQETYHRNLVNAALYVLTPEIFEYIEKDTFSDFGKDILPRLVSADLPVYAYNTTEYIKDIGTIKRLKEVEEDYLSGKIKRLNKSNKQKAVFIDRDGVINSEAEPLDTPDKFKLLLGVEEALKTLNRSDYLAVVVTNQPIIAKGFASEKQVQEIHNYMEYILEKEETYLDRIYYCPHHPDKGYEGERKEFKIECDCRKPKTGMIEQAVRDMNIDLENSFIVGDSTVDIMTGISAGLNTILVRTGYAGEDIKYECQPDFIFEDLNEAVNFLIDIYDPLFERIESLIPFDLFKTKHNPLISVSGLSRSGKSTLSKIVANVINKRGFPVKILKLDNWLISVKLRESFMSVRDRYQYDNITVDIQNLLKGNKIRVKDYNPKTRTVSNKVHEFSLNEGEVLIVDGIVCLDVEFLRNIADFKFYTEIREEKRKQRFYDFYRYKGLSEDLIDELYSDRQHDEYKIIVKSKRFADHIIKMGNFS